ncbi:MAG: transposase [Atopobium sp.]|jgi:putative transposase|nr:transposase [Atopobium sp.]
MRPPILTLDEDALKDEMRDLARGTVEEAINGILGARADELVDAGRCERTGERQAYGSGHYGRGPLTQAGKMEVGVPKLGGVRFTTEVTERHRRRESSVEEALVEMHLLGASTRNIEDVTRIPWDEGLSAGAASSLSQGAFKRVGAWVCFVKSQ